GARLGVYANFGLPVARTATRPSAPTEATADKAATLSPIGGAGRGEGLVHGALNGSAKSSGCGLEAQRRARERVRPRRHGAPGFVQIFRLLIGRALFLLRDFQDAMQACQLQYAPSQRRGIDQTKHAAGALSRIAQREERAQTGAVQRK